MNRKTYDSIHAHNTGAALFIPRNTLSSAAIQVKIDPRINPSNIENPKLIPANGKTPVKCQIIEHNNVDVNWQTC